MDPEEAYQRYVPAANPIELLAAGEPTIAMQVAVMDKEAPSTDAATKIMQVARGLVMSEVWPRLSEEVRQRPGSREALARWLVPKHVHLGDTYDDLAERFERFA